MKLRSAVLITVTVAALAGPATALAATLSVDKACYGAGERVQFSGGGYTPNGAVALSVSGRQLGVGSANAVGEFTANLAAPEIDGKRRTDIFTATDQANLALTASVPVLLTSLNVAVKPRNGDPSKPKRIVARGFTKGRTLYAHVRRGKVKRNLRVGRLKGPCGTLSVKRRLFPPGAKPGLYKVQFDARRRYSASTTPQMAFMVTVFQTVRPARASAAG
ncbi:MAG TPA: hypothetical protein VHF88_09260 [Thermoleophilaceae bacterium]|nr:hypothetical protein [Thermoleophilaceae bacterium]